MAAQEIQTTLNSGSKTGRLKILTLLFKQTGRRFLSCIGILSENCAALTLWMLANRIPSEGFADCDNLVAIGCLPNEREPGDCNIDERNFSDRKTTLGPAPVPLHKL
jgi:hypothetical protein